MKKLLFICLSFIWGASLFAQEIPEVPKNPSLVTDFANVLSANEKTNLERKLVDYFVATSTQIAIVTIPDLGGNEISDYAFKLGEKWGIGGAKFDNGIVILFKPKTSASRGQVFIATGYGLEGVVPDATAKQIVEAEMVPNFKVNNIYGGFNEATDVLIELTKGEYNYQQYAKHAKSSGGFNPFIILILIFFVFPILFGRRRRGYYGVGGRSNLPFWLALGMLSGGRRSHSGSFNDFSSGSGSFGSSGNSFGSFGGFGGGGFGGGGAGGSW